MKKKIFLIFSIVFSMFIGINNVKAIEYACSNTNDKLITEYAGSSLSQPKCCPANFNYGSRWNGGVQIFGCFNNTTDSDKCKSIGGTISSYDGEKECFASTDDALGKVTYENTDKGTQVVTCKANGKKCNTTSPKIGNTSEKMFLGYSRNASCSSIDYAGGVINVNAFDVSTLYACYDETYVICEYDNDLVFYYGKNTLQFYNGSTKISNAQLVKNGITKKMFDNYYQKKEYCPTTIYHQSGSQMTSYGITKSSGCPGVFGCKEEKLIEKKIVVENVDVPIDNEPDDINSCGDLISDNARGILNEIMKWIRISVPIILIGLGTLDFTKAVFSKSEDDMKKSREKFIKRLVAAILVFLVPMFVNFILDLANNVWSNISPDTCIK